MAAEKKRMAARFSEVALVAQCDARHANAGLFYPSASAFAFSGGQSVDTPEFARKSCARTSAEDACLHACSVGVRGQAPENRLRARVAKQIDLYIQPQLLAVAKTARQTGNRIRTQSSCLKMQGWPRARTRALSARAAQASRREREHAQKVRGATLHSRPAPG